MNRTSHLITIACCLVACTAVAVFAQGNGFVGIYADAQGTTACTNVPQGTGTTLYVLATLQGGTAAGISGAEFRVEVSNPSGWFFSYTPPTGTLTLGNVLDTDPANPSDGSGLNIAFTTCQSGTGGKVSLGTIGVYNATGAATSLSVKRHSRPSNAEWSCALFVGCDTLYSKVCMSGGSEPPCNLLRTAARTVASDDPAVFVAGLNAEVEGGGGGAAEPHPMPQDPLVQAPWLLYNPAEPDIVGIDAESKPALSKTTVVDTAWIGDWHFEGGQPGGCSLAGKNVGPAEPWTAKDNLVRNDGPSYWIVDTHYAGIGCIVSKAAELRSSGCWTSAGYGNNWDQSVKLKYKGTGSYLSFDYLSDSEQDWDYVTVEADSGGQSDARVNYQTSGSGRWPAHYRAMLDSVSGYRSGCVTQLSLPTFGQPSVEHAVYIRFYSGPSGSDEDGKYPTTLDAGSYHQ